MKWKVLKQIADTDSITVSATPKRGIVNVNFTILGERISAQYDADNQGLYGIELYGDALCAVLGRDENGELL